MNNIPLHGYTTFCLSYLSLPDGYLGCSHLLAIMNNAAMSICVQVFILWTCFFILCEHIFISLRCGIGGPYGNINICLTF